MISISLDRSPAQFRPGDKISGTVSWTDLRTQTEGIETRLLWYTEGKGSQDLNVVEALPTDVAPSTGSVAFEFTAPTRPFSFSGKLISLLWTIEVVVLPSRDGFREPLTLSLDGLEIKLLDSYEDSALKSTVRFGK